MNKNVDDILNTDMQKESGKEAAGKTDIYNRNIDKTENDNIERFINQGLLYDFYGELLTENQKRIYEEVVLNDYSISEVAKDEGISRQSVSDMIKRCDRILGNYEEKLGLVSKFRRTKELVESIRELSREFRLTNSPGLIERIEKLSTEIIDL